MREFAIFTATFTTWAITGVFIALFSVGCIAMAYWLAAILLAPHFSADKVQWLATLAGIIAGTFSGTGVFVGFSTLATDARQSAGNAANREKPRGTPPVGGSSGQRSASSPPLPGSTRPDPRKEHNP